MKNVSPDGETFQGLSALPELDVCRKRKKVTNELKAFVGRLHSKWAYIQMQEGQYFRP
jgi:hypothetical protein